MGYTSRMETEKIRWIEEKKIDLIRVRKEFGDSKRLESWKMGVVYALEYDFKVIDAKIDIGDISAKVTWNISFVDETRKWYDQEQWVPYIGQFIESGRLLFIGEDGEKWGYEFENGTTYKLDIPEPEPKRGTLMKIIVNNNN